MLGVLLKYEMGKMGMFWAKWGQFLGEMGMIHIAIANNPHANTSLNCFGFSISNTKFKMNLKKKGKIKN